MRAYIAKSSKGFVVFALSGAVLALLLVPIQISSAKIGLFGGAMIGNVFSKTASRYFPFECHAKRLHIQDERELNVSMSSASERANSCREITWAVSQGLHVISPPMMPTRHEDASPQYVLAGRPVGVYYLLFWDVDKESYSPPPPRRQPRKAGEQSHQRDCKLLVFFFGRHTMDSRNLETASNYINNLLLARGLLKNGKPIDFAQPGDGAEKSDATMANIINLVNDLVLRRDVRVSH
jgi:hypothetical protein